MVWVMHFSPAQQSDPSLISCFLVQDESSVQQLIDACIQDDDKLYLCVSSPTIKDKPVQIRPWRLSDADFVLDASLPLDPRKTVFVGGVPRPLKAGGSQGHLKGWDEAYNVEDAGICKLFGD